MPVGRANADILLRHEGVTGFCGVAAGHFCFVYLMQLFHVPCLQQLKLPVDPAVSPTACTTTSQPKAWQLQQHVNCWTCSMPRTSVAFILEELQQVPCCLRKSEA